eukprot:gnl/MRDRNA2_/MRDRNA2_19878_c0_seq1.p1 gnl/MRDRNA2_/MRDRNA2_19878_c0~~gnl/MRDRNA2_/MRDRNA2_19878_c0_seq1.p1  ORF type:complete len:1228 (+),score=222.81 gnl/MRDRNA2_/MRDRNA2_19878_c0_seq1:1-3684(+)
MAFWSHEEEALPYNTIKWGRRLSDREPSSSTASPCTSGDEMSDDDGMLEDDLMGIDAIDSMIEKKLDSLVEIKDVSCSQDNQNKFRMSRRRWHAVLAAAVPLLISFGIIFSTGKLALSAQQGELGELTSSMDLESLQVEMGRHLQSSNTTGGHGSAHDDHRSSAFAPIAFLLLCFFCSAFCKWAVQKLPKALRLPHSVVLFIFGTLIAAVAHSSIFENTELAEVITNFSAVDPHVIFWLLLPALLYEDSCQVKWHVTKRVLPSALLLALPGVMLNTVLTASMMLPLGWDFKMALLLGSICSATDPVAVMAALHQLHAPEKLAELIAAESLLNDGSAVVLFQVFLKVVNGTQEFEIGYAIKFFLQLSICGPLIGIGFGIVAYLWLKTTKDFHLESLVQVVAVFGAFFVSEHDKIHVSGVLAVVVLGFFMSVIGRFALERANEHKHHVVISYVSLLSHEAIFVIAGVVSHHFLFVSHEITGKDWGELIYLYFLVHFTRAFVIGVCFPVLSRIGYGFVWKEAVLCTAGGLRGAVGLAMALLVHGDSGIGSYNRAQIAFHVSGLAMLTLAINGTTWPLLYRKLHVYPHRTLHAALLQRAVCQMDTAAENHLMLLKSHWFFSNCQFDKISELVPKVADRKQMKRAKTQAGFSNLTKERVAQTMQRIGWNTARLEALREQKQGPPRLQATDDILTAIHGNLFCSATHVSTGTEDPSHVKPFSVGELNEAEDEAEQAAETYQTIVNAAMAIYNEMFEVRTIREKPFIALKQSIAFAEEAIHGELQDHSFLVSDPELRGLEQRDPDSQMEKAILVAWRYLLYKCTTKEGKFWKPFDIADRHFNLWRLRVKIEWKTMAKHVETLLVFIMAHEQLLTEMHVLKEMPAWSKLAETITRAKVEFLELFFGPGCSSREYEMFTCVQHVLAARSTLVKKVLVIFDHVRMGLLSNDAAKSIIGNEVRPLMHELRAFVPTWRHIKVLIGGGKRPMDHNREDRQDHAQDNDRRARAVRRSSMLSQDHFDQTMDAARAEMIADESSGHSDGRHVSFGHSVESSSSDRPSQSASSSKAGGAVQQTRGGLQKNVNEPEDWDCAIETQGAHGSSQEPMSPGDPNQQKGFLFNLTQPLDHDKAAHEDDLRSEHELRSSPTMTDAHADGSAIPASKKKPKKKAAAPKSKASTVNRGTLKSDEAPAKAAHLDRALTRSGSQVGLSADNSSKKAADSKRGSTLQKGASSSNQ